MEVNGGLNQLMWMNMELASSVSTLALRGHIHQGMRMPPNLVFNVSKLNGAPSRFVCGLNSFSWKLVCNKKMQVEMVSQSGTENRRLIKCIGF